ncbi:MAG TPA: MurR/RpiR family transcriptional regulator [Solirubrobacteraceae bacterium]|nr:MurR/RpiR family transcriptional regulator [Solirubrobacteraceae bacterium]
MTVPNETSFRSDSQPSSILRSRIGRLPAAERRVAEVLLARAGETIHESVGELAQRARTSPATVVRLSRRLGYEGFAALKIALAQEAGSANQFGLPRTDADPSAPLYHQVMAADAHSLNGAAAALDAAAFARCQAAIAQAGEVLFAGVGASAALAALAAFRFSALGLRASAVPDALTQHLRAATLARGDACVAISHTGESRDTIDAVATARQAGATTAGITSFAGSPLTEAVDIALVCADPAARELFANPVALVSVLGALQAGVALSRPTAAPGAAARLIASHQY